jgi:ankyrin repeat protein
MNYCFHVAQDLHGDTPMHLSLRPNANLELVHILLSACPNVAYESNKEGL